MEAGLQSRGGPNNESDPKECSMMWFVLVIKLTVFAIPNPQACPV